MVALCVFFSRFPGHTLLTSSKVEALSFFILTCHAWSFLRLCSREWFRCQVGAQRVFRGTDETTLGRRNCPKYESTKSNSIISLPLLRKRRRTGFWCLFSSVFFWHLIPELHELNYHKNPESQAVTSMAAFVTPSELLWPWGGCRRCQVALGGPSVLEGRAETFGGSFVLFESKSIWVCTTRVKEGIKNLFWSVLFYATSMRFITSGLCESGTKTPPAPTLTSPGYNMIQLVLVDAIHICVFTQNDSECLFASWLGNISTGLCERAQGCHDFLPIYVIRFSFHKKVLQIMKLAAMHGTLQHVSLRGLYTWTVGGMGITLNVGQEKVLFSFRRFLISSKLGLSQKQRFLTRGWYLMRCALLPSVRTRGHWESLRHDPGRSRQAGEVEGSRG